MLFGGETADIYLHEDEEGDLRSYGPLLAKFYDAFDDSASPVLDLLSVAEEVLVEVAVVGTEGDGRRGQLPAFWGPDEVYELWVSVNDSPRQLLRPVNVGSNLRAAQEAVAELVNGADLNPFNTSVTDLLDVDGDVVEVAPEGSTLIKLSNGLYGSGSSPIPLSDIIWVAAADAPANFQGAPYLCDGTADHVEINQALSNAFGLKVGLSPGTFAVSEPIRIRHSADSAGAAAAPASKYLIGSGQSVTQINVPSGVIAGIYFYDNVSPHVWDLTINVTDQRGIWAFRTSGAGVGYRSAFNGSIRRVTIAGPQSGTHGDWGMSLKSADKILVEEVTVTGTRYGMEVVTEAAEQLFGQFTFRNCRVTIVGDSGQCYRTGNDAGELRQITFDTCTAMAATSSQVSTEGFRLSSIGGQTYGVTLINCSSYDLSYGIHTWPNTTDVDADFAIVRPRQNGWCVWAQGSNSRFKISEFQVPASVTIANVMADTGVSSMPNQYWHHIYTQAPGATVNGTLGNGIIRRGVAEGAGTAVAGMLRSPSRLIDRTDIDPAQVTTTSSVGTTATNWAAVDTKMRTSLNGKVLYGWFRLRTNLAITPSSNNITDVLMFTLNSAYRPTETVYALWSSGTSTGALSISPAGAITLATGNQALAANAVLTFTFHLIKD